MTAVSQERLDHVCGLIAAMGAGGLRAEQIASIHRSALRVLEREGRIEYRNDRWYAIEGKPTRETKRLDSISRDKAKRCPAKRQGRCELQFGHAGNHVRRESFKTSRILGKDHGPWTGLRHWNAILERAPAGLGSSGGGWKRCGAQCNNTVVRCDRIDGHAGSHRGLGSTQRGTVVEWEGAGVRGWHHLPIGDVVSQLHGSNTRKANNVKHDDESGRMDGTDCGVRDGAKGAACILTNGHLGAHSSGKRTWPNKPPKAKAPAKPMKPSKNANIQTGRSAGLEFSDNTRILGYRSHPIAALWPLLEGEEFDDLVASIKARGLDEDIVLVKIDGETLILDGRNRGRACVAAGVKPRTTRYIGKTDLESIRSYVDARNRHRRQLSKSQLAFISAEGDRLCQGNSPDRSTSKGKSQAERAKARGLSERLQRKADRVADHATPKVKEAVRKGKMSVEAAEPLSKLPPKKQDEIATQALAGSGETRSGKIKTLVRQEHKRDVVRKINNEQVHPMPVGPFRAIVIDPPWPYEQSDQHEGARGHIPYPPMPIADIMRMRADLDKLVHEDGCILFMWVTNHFIHEVGRILEAWGFTHKTMLTWDKGKMGMGVTWARGRTEHVVIATRGTLIHTINEIETLFGGKVREHSRKPDKLAEIIEQHCQGPFVELFAQEPRTNWASWGAEANKFSAAKGAA